MKGLLETRAAIFEVMTDAALVADDERRYVDLNPAAELLFGLPRAAILGKRIEDFAPPPHAFSVERSWQAFLRDGIQEGLFPLVRPDGSRRLVEFRARAHLTPGKHLSVLRDVTDRHRNDAHFANLADSLPFTVARFDRDHRHLYINGTIFKYTGRTAGEYLGKTNRELGMPDTLVERWHASIDAAFAGQESVLEFEWTTPQGPRVFSWRAFPERFEDQPVDSVLAITRDVTEERQRGNERAALLDEAESARRAAEALAEQLSETSRELAEERGLLEAVMRHAPSGIVVTEAPSGKLLAMNPAAETLWGTFDTLREVYPQRPTFNLDGSPRALTETGLERALRGESSSQHVRLIRPTGDLAWARVNAAPIFDEAGSVRAAVAITEETTEEVQLQAAKDDLLRQVQRERAKLDALLSKIPVPVIVYRAPDFIIERANAAFQALLPGRQLEGLPVAEAVPEVVTEASLDRLREVIRTGVPSWRSEFPMQWPGPNPGETELRYFNLMYQPLEPEPGQPGRVVSAVIDVTAGVQARAGLTSALHFAEQFVGILGHDLRSPLSAIAMGATLLQRKADDPEARTLQRIRSSADRMARMIDQLLDLTRARLAGGIPIDRSPVDLSAVISAQLDELLTAHPERSVQVSLPVGLLGEWDGDRLAQVVTNLLGNALEHGDPDQPVSLALDLQSERGAALLTVNNRGEPIPPDLLPALFDPFRRGRLDPNAQNSGLGLGLFIAREIVTAHGGDLSVRSSAHEGTTFTMTLPGVLAQGVRPSHPAATSPADGAPQLQVKTD